MIGVDNRIDRLFAENNTKKFIPFLTVGDPNIDVTFELVHALVEAGSDLIELGIPYSDPLADGPTIQRASQRALANRIAIRDALSLVARLRESGITIPLVIFTYFNPVLQYGVHQFFRDLAEYGADGAIIPDLPVEEADEASQAAVETGTHLIPLVAPTSEHRIKLIADKARGFIYCVSSLGVTGARSSLSADLDQFLGKVRESTTLPLAVGFGISTAEQVKTVAAHVDGVVVGSAIVQEIERNLPLLTDSSKKTEGIENVKRFVKSLSGALK